MLGKLHRLDLDLGGFGKKQTIIWSEKTWTTGRGDHDASEVYLFPKGKDLSKWFKMAPSLEEPFNGMENLLGLGTDHRLFQFQKHFYFLNSARLGASS